MKAPLYADAERPRICPPTGNLGLWYTRFFDRYLGGPGWSVDESSKRGWIDAAAGRQPGGSLAAELEAGARRRIELVDSCGGDLAELRTTWHFVTGLGLPHPVENGFAWHPTLGLPYLPATSVKGLLGAWLWTVSKDEDRAPEEREEATRRLEQWCGERERAGRLIFFDALPTEPPVLTGDIMTPHLGKWYADGATLSQPDREPQKVPADWHSPVPVPFLVVERATFLFGVAPRPGADWSEGDPAGEVAAALEELEEALTVLGAGAKTAVGYGRFGSARSILYEVRQEEEEKKRGDAEAERRATALTHFDGIEPPVSEVLENVGLAGVATRLVNEMEKGERWSGETRRELARRVQAFLFDQGDWIEDAASLTGKKRKKKQVRNTLKVMQWLES